MKIVKEHVNNNRILITIIFRSKEQRDRYIIDNLVNKWYRVFDYAGDYYLRFLWN